MKSLRKGFTLIELLVVIAIIAILAAILFPVFAQAKAAAKKTQSLSNLKNIATAAQIYIADVDDTYGAGVPFVSTLNSWRWDRFIPMTQVIPATANASAADGVNSMMSNAMVPYLKNVDIWRDPVANPFPTGAASTGTAVGLGSVLPAGTPSISYTYNGLLQGMSATAIAAPASLTVYWTGQGKRALTGYHYASPQLICNTPTAPCQYVPPASGCGTGSGVTNGQISFYTSNSSGQGFDMHNRNYIYAYADGHAKSARSGVYTTGPTDPRTDPFAVYNGQFVNNAVGARYRYWDRFYCHGYIFRPDFDFANWDTVLRAD